MLDGGCPSPRNVLSSAKKRSGLHLPLRDLASSCRMWLVPAHPLVPFLTCRRRGRESVPSQTARFVSRMQGEVSTFERCHTRPDGSCSPGSSIGVKLWSSSSQKHPLSGIVLRTRCSGNGSLESGRPGLPKNRRELIPEMAHENPTWGEERIADELKLKLGIRVSPRTVRKCLNRQGPGGGSNDQRWNSFVRNQAKAIVACDFFISITLTSRVLYMFVRADSIAGEFCTAVGRQNAVRAKISAAQVLVLI
jgi:hypothetical protein